eukprot:CFRG6366T1
MSLVVKSGRGGRVSVSGHTVTVLGATGQIGRYLVQRLGRMGTQMVIPYRGDEMHFRHLRPMGDVGQINFVEYSIKDKDSLRDALRYSDVVYNLVGAHRESKNFRFSDVHVSGAQNVAEVAQELGVDRLIHMSAVNAAVDSPSKFLKSKALGEEAVLAAYPSATIVRTSDVFGAEDRLFRRWQGRKMLPGGIPIASTSAVKCPVFSHDVGHGLANLLEDPYAKGTTYEFVGPEFWRLDKLLEYMLKITKEDVSVYELSPSTFQLLASVIEKYPLHEPILNRDEVIREGLCDTLNGLPGLEEAGVCPTPLSKVAIQFLRQYRRHAVFDDVLTDAEARGVL